MKWTRYFKMIIFLTIYLENLTNTSSNSASFLSPYANPSNSLYAFILENSLLWLSISAPPSARLHNPKKPLFKSYIMHVSCIWLIKTVKNHLLAYKALSSNIKQHPQFQETELHSDSEKNKAAVTKHKRSQKWTNVAWKRR